MPPPQPRDFCFWQFAPPPLPLGKILATGLVRSLETIDDLQLFLFSSTWKSISVRWISSSRYVYCHCMYCILSWTKNFFRPDQAELHAAGIIQGVGVLRPWWDSNDKSRWNMFTPRLFAASWLLAIDLMPNLWESMQCIFVMSVGKHGEHFTILPQANPHPILPGSMLVVQSSKPWMISMRGFLLLFSLQMNVRLAPWTLLSLFEFSLYGRQNEVIISLYCSPCWVEFCTEFQNCHGHIR